MYWRFFFIFIVFLIVITTGEYVIYLLFKQLNFFKYLYIKNILIILGIVLPLMFVGAMAYGSKHFSLLNSWFYTAGAIWLGIITYIFIATIIVSILILINNSLGFNWPIKGIYLVLIILALGITTYGIYSASNPRLIKWAVNSPSLASLWKDKKIIIISDIHLGDVRREKFMQKVVDIIKTEKPDIVFNLGDLIDGPAFPYGKGFAPIYELNPSLGNYYVEGNHEGYNMEYSVFKSNFPKNLNDITGKKIMINNTQIIGIPYGMMKSKEDIINELKEVTYDKNVPSIILMHDPKDIPYLAENNISLVLSGHTHAGQFFPFTLLLQKMYGKYNHGVAYTSNTSSITSSGVGTAIVPIRVGTTPEIIELTIK